MNVTAVLITREDTWPRHHASLGTFPFANVIVVPRCPDILTRWTTALTAKTDTIYVQDDDATIDIDDLWARYDGKTITNVMTPDRIKRYAGTGVTLIGWGAFFPKSLIDFSLWHYVYGAVPLMHADYVFTYNKPHNTHLLPIRFAPRHARMLSSHKDWNPSVDDVLHKLSHLTDSTK